MEVKTSIPLRTFVSPQARLSQEPDYGVQFPEVGVPGDWFGRGFTSTGYGSIGLPA